MDIGINSKPIKLLLIVFIVIFTLFISEIGGYLWHRFGAHTSFVPPVRETHIEHHISDLTHDAHEDFYWILLVLSGIAILFLILTYYGLPWYIGATIYTILFLSYTWTWYIHAAYHTENHWLERYDWFNRDRKLHFQHHQNVHTNYSIATHFPDKIFGTYSNATNNLSLDRPWETYNIPEYKHININ